MTNSYFYDNIHNLIGNDLLLSNEEDIVTVEELFNLDVDFDINPALLNDEYILILYILCIHKMSMIQHQSIMKTNILQFFEYYKKNDLLGGNYIIALDHIKNYIKNKVLLITPKHPE